MALEIPINTGLPEVADWVRPPDRIAPPTMTLRPHHLRIRGVKDALLAIRPVHKIVDSYKQVFNTEDPGIGYAEDVMGRTPESFERFGRALGSFFADLGNLPDDSSIQLDLARDGMCEAACVGRHCVTTNLSYQKGENPLDTPDAEMSYVLGVVDRLIDAGYSEGTDFETIDTHHELQDFGGRSLQSPRIPVSREVRFQSLVVRTGALREVVRIIVSEEQRKAEEAARLTT